MTEESKESEQPKQELTLEFLYQAIASLAMEIRLLCQTLGVVAYTDKKQVRLMVPVGKKGEHHGVLSSIMSDIIELQQKLSDRRIITP